MWARTFFVTSIMTVSTFPVAAMTLKGLFPNIINSELIIDLLFQVN
jgi:hypothetical protein